MATSHPSSPRTAVLCGPYQSGKSTLFEALLAETGAHVVHGRGLSLADNTAEAKAHAMSTELNVASAEYLGESWTLVDCPGSIELTQETRNAISMADIAVVVVDPDADKAMGLASYLKMLDQAEVPHMVFINKFDKKDLSARALLQAFQGVSDHPLVLREIPIHEGDVVTGHIDLVSERAFHWEEGANSSLIEIPTASSEREVEARAEMMESLADFDDGLLEKILEDIEPSKREVYDNLATDLSANLVVPVFFGSAEQGHGTRRLFKALRHDAPGVEATAERLGIAQDGQVRVKIFKTLHAGHAGKVSMGRILSGALNIGDHIAGVRPSGMHRLFGRKMTPTDKAVAGDVIGLTKLEDVATGDLAGTDGRHAETGLATPPTPLFSLAIRAKKRGDDVKLPENLRKLLDEDLSLSSHIHEATGELLLCGQGDMQLKLALEKLKSRYGLDVTATIPRVAFCESITKPASKKVRHRKQSGGHGEFGEVELKISPRSRGEGFAFSDSIHGGVVPRQYFSAVEAGVRDAMVKGPQGFQVVDVAVELTDGKHHSVDSSDLAFRKAGAQAMREALAKAGPIMLEPVNNVRISVPDQFIASIQKIITARHGQIFGLEAKDGWLGWEDVTCQIPVAEMQDLITEIRSVTQGVGSFEASFDHLQEVAAKDVARLTAAQ